MQSYRALLSTCMMPRWVVTHENKTEHVGQTLDDEASLKSTCPFSIFNSSISKSRSASSSRIARISKSRSASCSSSASIWLVLTWFLIMILVHGLSWTPGNQSEDGWFSGPPLSIDSSKVEDLNVPTAGYWFDKEDVIKNGHH